MLLEELSLAMDADPLLDEIAIVANVHDFASGGEARYAT